LGIALGFLLAAACSSGQSPGKESPQKRPQIVAFDGALSSDRQSRVVHGERLVAVLDCRSCHGRDLAGAAYPMVPATNLTRDVPSLSNGQLERIFREGRRPGGRELWGMPSEVLQHLSNADTDALIAYLRTLRPVGPQTGAPAFTAADRKAIADGKVKSAAQWARELRNQLPVDLGPRYALGRYITIVACAECHGTKLEGGAHGSPPNLDIISAYSPEAFEKLITTGVPIGNRTLKPMMSDAAKDRFSHLTHHERDELYAYLRARAARS
jgi:cytochrome c553